jgi:hypothetical protein
MKIVDQLKPLFKQFENACKKIAYRRNKWIAHYDYEKMLDRDLNSRTEPSRAEIETALDALRKFMNCIEGHYTRATMLYEIFDVGDGGNNLISTLSDGLHYQHLIDQNLIDKDL